MKSQKKINMTMRPDDHRRKWDKKEYERKALDRIQKIGTDDGKMEKFCFSFIFVNIAIFYYLSPAGSSGTPQDERIQS